MPIADQRGASLIEVLVSILILSIGLLGMAGLQTRTLKGNHSALQRSEVVTLTHFIFDAMRANLAHALGVDVENVGVAATTTEKLGWEGQGEGIGAWAVCLLQKTVKE